MCVGVGVGCGVAGRIFINVEAATESICHSMRHSHGSGDGQAILSQTLAKTSDTVFPYLLPLILHRLLASAMNIIVACPSKPVGGGEYSSQCVVVSAPRNQSVRAFRRKVIKALSMGADMFQLQNFDLFVWLDDEGVWELMNEYLPLGLDGGKRKLRPMASYDLRPRQVLLFQDVRPEQVPID